MVWFVQMDKVKVGGEGRACCLVKLWNFILHWVGQQQQLLAAAHRTGVRASSVG